MNDNNNEESRLGHDPLEWLMDDEDDDESELADTPSSSTEGRTNVNPATASSHIDTQTEKSTHEEIAHVETDRQGTHQNGTPHEEASTLEIEEIAAPEQEDTLEIEEPVDISEEQTLQINQPSESSTMDEIIDDDGAWGIFASEDYGMPLAEEPAEPELEDDGTWGLFEEDEVSSQGKVIRVELPRLMVISQIETIKNSFKMDWDDSSMVNIYGEAVEDADTAGIQLLYSLVFTLLKNGIEVRLFDQSSVLKQRAETAGLSHYFASIA